MRLVELLERPSRFKFTAPATVEWDGRTWWRDRKGYFLDADGRSLHRSIYAAVFGPVPIGHHVHHVDGDSQNNHFCNLLALPHGRHSSITASTMPRSAVHREKVGKASRLRWSTRPFVTCTCVGCGAAFQSRAMARPARFCGPSCVEVWRSNRFKGEDRSCAHCGTQFHAASRAQRFCSRTCNRAVNNWFAIKAKPIRNVACEQCGTIVRTRRANARFCGRDCAVTFHSREGSRRRRKVGDAG